MIGGGQLMLKDFSRAAGRTAGFLFVAAPVISGLHYLGMPSSVVAMAAAAYLGALVGNASDDKGDRP
jgi:hypothetical protein